MKPFSAPVEDILFTLEHVADAARLEQWDSELAREIISHFGRFAEEEIAPIDEQGDLDGCRLENGRVKMPESFKSAYKSFAEQGWTGLTMAEEHGGQNIAAPIYGAVSEILCGACHALHMSTSLAPGAARTIMDFGNEEQKARFIPPISSGQWLTTMCLTEPGAGSDLGAVRTRAEADGDRWKITGEKIFISGGDHDLSEGILHLVLARTGEMDEGTRGLSLFVCLSDLADGSRNAINVARIEEKMGIHASPTCQLAFDGAVGELIGKPGEGLKAMFTMMNHARLDVALQGAAHATRANDIARSYAEERLQGRLPGHEGMVAINKHADVARMLNEQDALALGGRAMCQYALVTLDANDNPALLDFLTPICKAFCTDAAIHAANLGIQVLGGYGYLHEYRMEQVLRDARIAAIYEGTNGIHALTLATRMLRLNDGACADAFAQLISNIAESALDNDGLEESFDLWKLAREDMLATNNPAEKAHAFMKLSSLVMYQAMWQLIAAKSSEANDKTRIDQLAAFVKRTAILETRYWAAMQHSAS